MKVSMPVVLGFFVSLTLPAAFAIDQRTAGLIAAIYSEPPQPCIAKRVEDKSSGIAIFPSGKSDEQLRRIMGGFAAVFLEKGAELLAPQNTTAVYTAVFYEEQPINEIGIYGYHFAIPITAEMFSPRKGLNGRFIVVDSRLLILLWRENSEKTVACFRALENSLAKHQ
jgi:hypothetical protein